MKIKLSDYTRFPAGRTSEDGSFPGDRFRLSVVEQLDKHPSVEVDLDGCYGFGGSFLEEVFGGLVRVHGIEKSKLQSSLKITCEDEPEAVKECWSYIESSETGK